MSRSARITKNRLISYGRAPSLAAPPALADNAYSGNRGARISPSAPGRASSRPYQVGQAAPKFLPLARAVVLRGSVLLLSLTR